MSEIRVLVVDEYDLVRVGLASLLATLEDLDVVGQAASGALAVRLAGEVHPDVVLLGLSLQDAGASAWTRQLLAQHPGVRVIVLAERRAENQIADALRAGACGYLHKEHMPLEEIVAAIRAAARGRTWQPPRAAQTPLEQLTPRELEVLELVERGLRRAPRTGRLRRRSRATTPPA